MRLFVFFKELNSDIVPQKECEFDKKYVLNKKRKKKR
jgi:hypothetical protein